MIRFSFTLDVIASKLVTVSTAFYRVDGTLRLENGTGVVFEEEAVPLVELAVWVFHWLTEPKGACVFLPEGYDEDYGPLLQLAPAEGTAYRLTYADGTDSVHLTAESAEWETVFQHFLQDLRYALQHQYQVPLDAILLSFKSST